MSQDIFFKELNKDLNNVHLPNHVGNCTQSSFINEEYNDEVFKRIKYNDLTTEDKKHKIYEHEYTGKKVIILIHSDSNQSSIIHKSNRNLKELIELVSNLKNKYELELNGTEALTDLEYLKTFKLAGQHFLLSNGKVIVDNPKTIDVLKENDINSVSLIYNFDEQDQFAAIPVEKLNEIINKLQENGIEVRLITTITSKNYNQIEEICKKSIDLGAKGIKFTNLVAQGKNFNLYNYLLNDEEKKQFFEQLSKVREEYDKDTLIIERCGTFGKNLCISKSNFKCICGREQVVLAPNNKLYPCIFLSKKGYEIGKLKENKLLVSGTFTVKTEDCLVDEVCNKTLLYKRRTIE